MAIIWLQSHYFNPGQIAQIIIIELPQIVFVLIGITFELLHLVEFGLLYFLFIMVFLTFGRLNSKKEIVALVITLVYSFVDETHQYFVPHRSFSIVDMIKNVIGIIVVWYLVRRSYYASKYNKLGLMLNGFTNVFK
ncbi:VanZ family protein [Bacillus sp. 31A1R]|uniref:VanZ family protein n=2 Tax=Robertmurraya mangrovi TaxID=3098077 RepID=A0ABU5J1M9_9BACI|nr:VanZ family protein [Bacillus sp. 31A1R]